ncbi:MAG: hypothetical protein ACHQ4G_13485 [Opitutales bacterium]
MNEHSPFESAPDAELGAALREALDLPFGGAFVNRVRTRLNQTGARSWDEELAGWFWQGLAAASLVTVLAGWGLNTFTAVADDPDTNVASVDSQLLDGSTPGANVLLAAMTSTETP